MGTVLFFKGKNRPVPSLTIWHELESRDWLLSLLATNHHLSFKEVNLALSCMKIRQCLPLFYLSGLTIRVSRSWRLYPVPLGILLIFI